MKKLIRCLFVMICIGIYSCSKKDLPKPLPEVVVPDTVVNNGTNPPANPPVDPPVNPPADPPAGTVAEVSGTISPLNILPLISANLVNRETNAKLAVAVSSTGAYKVFAKQAGSYELQINLNSDGKMLAAMSLVLRLGTIEHISFSLEGHPGLPKPKGTSSIKGKVNPVPAKASVVAALAAPNVSYEGTISSTGEFEFKDLPAGDYTVGINPGAGYTPVVNRFVKVTVGTGETADAGTIAFYVDSDPATPNYISYNMDGVVYTRKNTVGITYDSPKFRLFTYNSGYSTTMVGTRVSVIGDQLELILDEVTGPGTYVCKGTAGSAIRITRRDYTMYGYSQTAKTWSSIGEGGSGTVTITSIDPVTRTMSGTFSATLVPENPYAALTKKITNGAFANYKY